MGNIKQTIEAKNTHGGKRNGAGQPKKAPTRVLSVRVLESDYDVLKAKINELILNHNKPKNIEDLTYSDSNIGLLTHELNVVDGVVKSITVTNNRWNGYTSPPKETI